jgi:DNA repair exonuclease SbcCD ATPase subunit
MPQDKTQQPEGEKTVSQFFSELEKRISDTVTKEEIAQIVQTILKTFATSESELSNLIAKNMSLVGGDIESIRQAIQLFQQSVQASLAQVGENSSQSLQVAVQQLQDSVNAVQAKIPVLPDYTEKFKSIEAKIPTIEKDYALQKEVNDLEKEIATMKKELKRISQLPTGDGGGIVGRDLVRNYDLSGYLDGSTKTFNLPAIWSIVSVATSSFPNVLRPLIDYTYTGQSITFTSEIDASTTLAAGQTVVITLVSM